MSHNTELTSKQPKMPSKEAFFTWLFENELLSWNHVITIYAKCLFQRLFEQFQSSPRIWVTKRVLENREWLWDGYMYIFGMHPKSVKNILTFFDSIYRRFWINNDFWLVRIFFWSVFTTGIFSVNSRILIYDPNLDFVSFFHFISGFISHLKTQNDSFQKVFFS